MRQHNGTILVTEALSIVQFDLDDVSQGLPSIPTGDAGNQILQVTLRSVDSPWEFRFGTSGDYFWMGTGDIVVLPFLDRQAITRFEFKALTTADMRIIYEA